MKVDGNIWIGMEFIQYFFDNIGTSFYMCSFNALINVTVFASFFSKKVFKH